MDKSAEIISLSFFKKFREFIALTISIIYPEKQLIAFLAKYSIRNLRFTKKMYLSQVS